MIARVLALAIVVAACSPVASVLPARETVRTGGPGWSLELPLDLGLEAAGVATEFAGTWTGGRTNPLWQLNALLVWDAKVGLDAYLAGLANRAGSNVKRQEPIAMPQGRATLVVFSHDLTPDLLMVLIEPRPGVIVSVDGMGLAEADVVAIARSLRIER